MPPRKEFQDYLDASEVVAQAVQAGDLQLDYDKAGTIDTPPAPGRELPAFASTIQGPSDLSTKKWKAGDEVPPSVCIRHGRYLPCKPFANDPDCLVTTHPKIVPLVDAYQRNTDAVRWDFEHVVRSWIYLMKGQGAE